jgi:hypothetical protein
VSPAVADLQAESSQGWRPRCRHYVGLSLVFGWALVVDLRADVIAAFDVDARRTVWLRAVCWYLAALVPIAWMQDGNVPWHLLDAAARHAALVSSVLTIAFAATAPATAVAVFYLRRRGVQIRSIAAVTVLIVAATTACWLALGPYIDSLSMQIYQRVDSALPTTAREVGNADYRWSIWLDLLGDSLRDTGTPWRDGVSLVGWALLGFVLAKDRGWRVPARLAAFFVATWLVWLVLVFGVLLFSVNSWPPPSTAAQRWRDVLVMLATGLVWLLLEQGRKESPGDSPAA